MTETSGQPYPVYQPMVPMGPMVPANRRPGVTTTAAILGFVQAGLAIFGGLITLFATAGATLDEQDVLRGPDPFRAEVSAHTTVTTVLAVVVIFGSGVVIAGAVTLNSGSNRVLYLAGMGLQLVFCVAYFTLTAIALNRIGDVRALDTADNPGYGFMVAAVLFAVMPVLGLVFASVGSTTRFLRVKAAEPGVQYAGEPQ